jgi:hypothetical protein
MSAKPAARVADITEWYATQYTNAVGVSNLDGSVSFKTMFEQFPVKSSNIKRPAMITGIRRMSNFLSLKMRYPLGPDGYSVLTMSAMIDGRDTHFGYAYWRCVSDVDPEYICVGPTFESRDGEYRSRFIRYAIFAREYERMTEILAPTENDVLRLVGESALTINSTVYPSSASDAIVAHVSNSRLPIVAFVIALHMDLQHVASNSTMTHMSAAYVSIMTAFAALRPDALVRSQKSSQVGNQRLALSAGYRDMCEVVCGQKIVPLFMREVMQPRDYNLASWRELVVTELVADLVLNYISGSFALYNQWTYVEDADSSLFENAAMSERYIRSQAIAESAASLREARRLVEASEHNYPSEMLSAQIYDSLEYAQSFLLVSPVAIVHTMEDVGVTMRGLPRRARYPPVGCEFTSILAAFASPAASARNLFELAYAAHCLHVKLGVAHTDLHSNNMTLYLWGLADDVVLKDCKATHTPYYPNPVLAYVTGERGEADTFIFPAAGTTASIIDYSRCILGPGFRAHLEEGRSEQYANNFYRDQVNRAMRVFHRYAPDYVTRNQVAIKAAVMINFEAAFPVLAAVDFMAIGTNMGAMLTEEASRPVGEHELRKFEVSKVGIELAGALETAGREALITGLHDLVETKGTRREMRTPAFPGYRILKTVFSEWLYSNWKARTATLPLQERQAQLVDAYNFTNPVRYSGRDYSKYPPWARLDEIEQHLGEHKITDLFERGVDPFLAALHPGARVDVIAEKIRAEQEKLDGAPVSADSSWLDE